MTQSANRSSDKAVAMILTYDCERPTEYLLLSANCIVYQLAASSHISYNQWVIYVFICRLL